MATAGIHGASLAVRGVNRRLEARHEIHHPRDSRRTGWSVSPLGGTRRQDGTAETSWPADESRSQGALLVGDPHHLVTAVAGTPSR